MKQTYTYEIGTHTCAHTHARTHSHTHTCTHSHTHMRMHTRTHTHTRRHTGICHALSSTMPSRQPPSIFRGIKESWRDRPVLPATCREESVAVLSPHCLPLMCRVLSVLLGVYLFTVCLFCVLVWRSVWKSILNPVTRVLKNSLLLVFMITNLFAVLWYMSNGRGVCVCAYFMCVCVYFMNVCVFYSVCVCGYFMYVCLFHVCVCVCFIHVCIF